MTFENFRRIRWFRFVATIGGLADRCFVRSKGVCALSTLKSYLFRGIAVLRRSVDGI